MPAHHHLQLRLFRLKPSQDWSVPREGLFFIFPKLGAGEYLCDLVAVQPLERGDVLVVQCGSRGKIRAALGSELSFYAFSLCLEHLFAAFIPEEIALAQPLLAGLRTARLHSASSSSAIRWHQFIREVPPGSDLEHRTHLLRIAGSILSEEFKKLRPPLSGRAKAHVIRIFERLSANQILNLSVAEMAGRFGCSQRQLNRLFNEHFGLSVGMLRMEMRLLKAAPLLRNPDLKIVEVARQCGFHHLGLFHACFKRRFGLSPGQWRRNYAKDEEPGRVLAGGQPRCRLREFGLCPLDYQIRKTTEPKPPVDTSEVLRLGPVAVKRSAEPVEARL